MMSAQSPEVLQRRKRRIIGYAIEGVIGACFGNFLGYMLYALGASNYNHFMYGWWLSYFFEYNGIWWTLFGGAIRIGSIVSRDLLRR
jgi:multisubunit Na+/H+ antiporter MnhB subunit